MSGPFFISVDGSEMAARFGERTPHDAMETALDAKREFLRTGLLREEPEEIGEDFRDALVEILDYLPAREADMIDMYYLRQKRQADIAEIFGVTQAAISYRLSRAVHRARFYIRRPKLSDDELRTVLERVGFEELNVRILIQMHHTTSQTATAQALGLTQGRVRHRFLECLKRLGAAAKTDASLVVLADYFRRIHSEGKNLARAISLPQWADKGRDEIF